MAVGDTVTLCDGNDGDSLRGRVDVARMMVCFCYCPVLFYKQLDIFVCFVYYIGSL